MYLGRQLLLCVSLLFSCCAGGCSKTQYVLSIPASLASGDTAKACLTLLGSEEKLDVSLILNHVGQNTSIISQDVPSSPYFQCAEFQVPKAPAAVPVAVLFSATGATTEILERKTVVITPTKTDCRVQMDKPIYKPGQKVRTRIICLNSQLKPVNEKFSTIYLQDPSRTRIAQWLQQETEHGIFSVDFQLIKDAPTGSYNFRFERESGQTVSQWFSVEEYVKPRFSISLEAPNTISVLDERMNLKVSGLYTFGEPLAGAVVVIYCKEPNIYGRRLNCLKDREKRCSNITGELGPDGTYSAEIDLTDTFMFSPAMSISTDVLVIEDGTGIQTKESRYTWVTSQPARLSYVYDEINQYYKRGLKYSVVAKLTDEQDRPIPNQDIEVELDGKLIETVKTDSEGKIDYGIDTTDMVNPNFTVKVSYKNPDQCYYAEWRDADYPTAEYTAFRFYSKSGSFLQAKRPKEELSCGQQYNIDLQYIINPSGVKEGATKLTIFYLVMANSKIVHSGQQDLDLTSLNGAADHAECSTSEERSLATRGMTGSSSIVLPVSADMAPSANLILYSVLKDELIVDTVELNIEKCFKNQVSMVFAQEKITPGSDAEVLISGDPESMCGVRVIDYSLVLLNPYESFSANTILNSLRNWFFGYNIAGFDVEDPAPPCEDPDKLVFFNGQYYLPHSSNSERDSYQNLKDVGLSVATDVITRKPVVCDKNPPEHFRQPIALESVAGSGAGFGGGLLKANADSAGRSASASIESLRTDFSENLMWSVVPLDGEGHARLTERAPDSITKWQGSAFCISERSGFGMTRNPSNMTTYLPFFMDLSTPNSIIRGEGLVLRAVVQNYLESYVKVQALLEPSEAFTAKLKEGQQDVCVGPNDRAAFSWEVDPKQIGEMAFTASAQTTFIGKSCDGPNDDSLPSRKDTVVQTTLVQPEGIRQERTLTNLVFLKGTKSVLPVSITPPNSVVADSITAYICAFGDVLGLPLSNLQDLVMKPYGCGEQNLARMAPIPHVLDYLNNTNQLTDEMLEKAKRFMTEGYYRQLGYLDGSAYRLFPNYGEQLNSWLTVYTFATFEKCKKHIFIDSTLQQNTLIWLENTQKLDTGCFRPQGTDFIKQDANNELYFTTYLAISLMESDYSLGMTLLDGAMECLKKASTTDQKIEDESIMLYAFTLAGLDEYRELLLKKVMKKAITDGGTIHWQREDMPEGQPVPFFRPEFSPAEVKMTAYVLLSLAAWPSRSEEDLTTMAQISMWLTRRMNPNGGFGSSSDTVVALQSLSALSKILYTPDSQQTVLVKRGDAEIANFDLNPKNRLVVQRQPLPDGNGDYIMEAEGSGWFVFQTTVTYYIPIPEENAAFSLALSTKSDNCLKGVANTFNISGIVSYNGYQNVSNMAIVKIRLLSGYVTDYFSLRELVNNKIIKRHEENRGELFLYLNPLSKEPMSFTFRVFMDKFVLNIKKSSAQVYDYYDPGENGYASYSHPCTEIKT